MNIAQELSIVRDNIAEYGMTNITQLEYDEIYQQGRADAIDELETKLIDIILGNEEFTDWQKQEISLCLECVIEQLKERKNED